MKHDAPPGAMARRKRAIAAITVAGALTSLPAANVRAVETSFVCTPTSLSIFAGHTSIRCTPKQGQIEFFALGYANSDQADRLLSVASTAFALKKKLTIFYDPDDTSGTSVGCLAKDCRLLRGLIMF